MRIALNLYFYSDGYLDMRVLLRCAKSARDPCGARNLRRIHPADCSRHNAYNFNTKNERHVTPEPTQPLICSCAWTPQATEPLRKML